MKDKKLLYIAIIMICLTVILGISYAWFSTIIEGNENAKKHTVTTGDLRLIYTDTDTISMENAFPGDSYEKTVSVKNIGTANANYSLVWQELSNNILNNELVIEGTCKRLNTDDVEEGECEDIGQAAISSLIIKNNILIEPGYTHEYSLKVTFLDIGEVQNYNKKKSFNGKIGIEEYPLTAFRGESWSTIVENVKAGNTDKYNIGDAREIDLGIYGIHTVRIANKSTPEECSTDGFSQTACGFVLEFENILSMRNMSTSSTGVYGWPNTELYTYLNADLYSAFPTDLKDGVIDTTVVSGRVRSGASNPKSTDKLYLLATAEVWSDAANKPTSDNASSKTRQLDYYEEKGVKTSNSSGAIKKFAATASSWWLRAAYYSFSPSFFIVLEDGKQQYTSLSDIYGISPAFRIG